MKILWFDTETTGLDPVKNDIIQIAGIIEIDGRIAEKFEFKCKPINLHNVEQEALDVHGFTEEEILKWQHPYVIYEDIKKILDTYVDKYDKADKFIPAGHNVLFDVNFLKYFFIKNNDNYYGSYVNYHFLDTLTLAITLSHLGLYPKPENFKLKTLAEIFDIQIQAHDAMSDINATRDLYKRLCTLIKK